MFSKQPLPDFLSPDEKLLLVSNHFLNKIFGAVKPTDKSPLEPRIGFIQSDVDPDTLYVPADEYDRIFDVVMSQGVKIHFDENNQFFYELSGKNKRCGPFAQGESAVICAYCEMRFWYDHARNELEEADHDIEQYNYHAGIK